MLVYSKRLTADGLIIGPVAEIPLHFSSFHLYHEMVLLSTQQTEAESQNT
jgi:hypothetical protein